MQQHNFYIENYWVCRKSQKWKEEREVSEEKEAKTNTKVPEKNISILAESGTGSGNGKLNRKKKKKTFRIFSAVDTDVELENANKMLKNQQMRVKTITPKRRY